MTQLGFVADLIDKRKCICGNDIDDAAPVITSGDTAVTVVENSPVGQVIYTATADDSADLNDGAALVFGIAGADADAFIIDSSTGEVTLNVSF